MLVITAAIKVVEIISQEGKRYNTIIGLPSVDGQLPEFKASVWIKQNRIEDPILNANYFCVPTVLDATSENLQVYTLLPLPDDSDPITTQVTVTGSIIAVTDDTISVKYRVYHEGVEGSGILLATIPGGWKNRPTVLSIGSMVQVIGKLEALDQVVVSNFHLSGGRVTGTAATTTPSSDRRRAVWSRRPRQEASSPAPTSPPPSQAFNIESYSPASITSPTPRRSRPPIRSLSPATSPPPLRLNLKFLAEEAASSSGSPVTTPTKRSSKQDPVREHREEVFEHSDEDYGC
ncbi:hypothetical protein DFS34DRAFT_645915 [Phlyctochytrium arcticum]|nr:hypothetical protein DFS34DRAFT_645915 [Phlyctochytrium arcticum]